MRKDPRDDQSYNFAWELSFTICMVKQMLRLGFVQMGRRQERLIVGSANRILIGTFEWGCLSIFLFLNSMNSLIVIYRNRFQSLRVYPESRQKRKFRHRFKMYKTVLHWDCYGDNCYSEDIFAPPPVADRPLARSFLMEHLLTNPQAALWVGENGQGFVRW